MISRLSAIIHTTINILLGVIICAMLAYIFNPAWPLLLWYTFQYVMAAIIVLFVLSLICKMVFTRKA